jgi:hypothetical protein
LGNKMATNQIMLTVNSPFRKADGPLLHHAAHGPVF